MWVHSICYTIVAAEGFLSYARCIDGLDKGKTIMDHSNPRKPIHMHIQPGEKAYGDFILDLSSLPPGLEPLGQQLAELQRNGRPYETAAARIELLREILARVQDEPACAPELRAALQHALAIAYQQHLSADRAQQMEASLQFCEVALQVYTLARHSYQYASVQITLGNAYHERVVGVQRDNLEQAIACYHEALRVFTLDTFPYEYAEVQHGLGQTYQLRIEGERQDNLEQAIAYCRQALSVHTSEAFPFKYAKGLYSLGTCYFRRVAGERRGNLEQAIDCFRRAAAIFTLEAFPVEYAQGQNNLGIAYSQRINGEQRDNLEQAITYYHQALHVYTVEAFPIEYARVQNNLGIAYWQRIAGERRDNLEQAINCYNNDLRVWTLEAFPFQYAMLQNNLGAVYLIRVQGTRRANLEQAIACYREALRIWTPEAFPYQYAKVQNNLGEAYQHRLAGQQDENLEQAIACYHQTLDIWTLHALPQDYAMAQRNLGVAYQLRSKGGERQKNLTLALAAHRESLSVYTLEAFPIEHRQVQLDCAETQALREDWEAAHDAYTSARKAEDLLVALGAGAAGRDAILKEGRDANTRAGFALIQLEKVEEAAVAIEGGRARGLAEAMQFNAADPNRVEDAGRRTRYMTAHGIFVAAQTALQAPLPVDLDEDSQRQLMLERTAAYREAKAAFDTMVAEIRAAQDPADFLNDTLDATMIIEAAKRCGQAHALVYLVATPWGGVAIATFASPSRMQTSSHFAAFTLHNLTDTFVGELIETRLEDADRITGGFDCAQKGSAFDLLQSWPGETFQEQAEALHEACIQSSHTGTLDMAAQWLLSIPQLAPLVTSTLTTISNSGRSLLAGTFNHAVLQRELQRCQSLLGERVLQPLVSWLREREAGVTSLTLVPCGLLAAFPLEGTFLSDGRTLGETLPTSMAPSARSLLRDVYPTASRTGIYALGNPYPTRQDLHWGEAEAFTLAELGSHFERTTSVKVQWQATRNWLIDALHTGHVVNASCHGVFDTRDFLRSRLILAHEEELTLADMLSYQADLRGLRLLILSACQTAILDLQGARDEVRSLAAGMLQAGSAAVLAALWAVDDRATYLLMVRFALEWFPHMNDEPPAAALARAQHWLRTVTNRALQASQITMPPTLIGANEPGKRPETVAEDHMPVNAGQLVAVRGRASRFDAAQAQEIVQADAEEREPDACPYADPYYWAGFQITGW